MPHREALSPLTNSFTPRKHPQSKHLSPSTSCRTGGLATPTSVLSSFADHDEGLQRKELRRRSQGFELHRKNLGSPNAKSPKTTDALNGLTSTQLASHYADCIKLSTENKINAKNAFGLHLIDYMTELVKKKELENFQVASSTLDASVKIYAGRVDFIHTHTYKVLSGLGGNHQKPETEEGNDNGDPGETDGAGKKKKKKAGKTHTTETNLKNINVEKFDLEFEVDPMFQIMSAAFDEGGARGLLLNRLRCYDDKQLLVLDSSTDVNIVEDQLCDTQHCTPKPLNVSDLKEMLQNLNLEDKKICPSLADFRFTEWNEDAPPMHEGFSEFAFDPLAEPQHLPSVEEEVQAIAYQQMEDLDNAGDDEACGSVNESGTVTGDFGTAEFVDSAFSDLRNGSNMKLRQILAMEPSDYSYFNKVLMRTWAGPAHWRVATTSRPSGVPTNGESRVQNKRKKKPPVELTYDREEKELNQLFKSSKATTVTKATWSNYTKKKTTLPEDQQQEYQDRLFRLFLQPHLQIKRQQADSIGVDDGIDNYDYNNKNDVDNFCPVVRDGDDDDDNDSSGGFDFSGETHFAQSQDSLSQQSTFLESGLNCTIFSQDKLVAAPNKVQKIDIKFAKAAKRIDVRKLKSTMWNILTKDMPECVEDLAMQSPPAVEESLSEMTTMHHFSRLSNILPPSVSPTMAKNLTIQTVFACLLYLTNEKTLKLSSNDMMDDLYIDQDSKS